MVKYLPLGDSYTIGEGAKISENWPSLLAMNLSNSGFSTNILAQPAVTGYTTSNLINTELPLIKSLNPNFITVLIGVNDWVQGVAISDFEFNYRYIIEYCLYHLKSHDRLISVTIPDFGVAPKGHKYAYGRHISRGLQEFNRIIINTNKKYSIKTVDIYPVSLRMKNEPDLVAEDGIHGSAKMYSIWEKLIFPIAYQNLSKTA